MQIQIPTLLLDEKKCRQNIQFMFDRSIGKRTNFRPHFKTHQSAEIGVWFKNLGVSSITVSSVQMASYFANAGWDDILIAFPVNWLEINNMNELAQKIKLHLLVESVETTNFLIENLTNPVGIYLKIDTGYHRTGLSPDDEDIFEILSLIKKSNKLKLTGILTHSGNTYGAENKENIIQIHDQSKNQMEKVKKRISLDFPDCILSIGDTPSCCLVNDLNGIDEIRPGNFVFFDVMQYFLGVCYWDQIALAMACPVVAKHKLRNEIIIYGGAVHLSKEAVCNQKSQKIYGLIVKLKNRGWDKPLSYTYISSLSQEHGTIKTSKRIFDQIRIGETIGVLPVHSCLTANLMNSYTTFSNGKISKFKFIS